MSAKDVTRKGGGEEAELLERLRQRAAERKGELQSEEDMLRRERRNLMSAKKRAERGEADMVTKLERLEREVERLSGENSRLMSQAEASRRRVTELEDEARRSPSTTVKSAGQSEEFSPAVAASQAAEQKGRFDQERLAWESARWVHVDLLAPALCATP